MQLLAALLILLVAVVGGALVLPVWPDAMTKLGLIEQIERAENLKTEVPPKPTTDYEMAGPDATATGDAPFDVAKVEPDGTSVFAGRSTPSSAVTVFADGVMVGTATTDENGEWVMIVERQFANPDPKLTVHVGPVQQPSPSRSPVVTVAAAAPASAAPTAAELLDQLRHKTEQARAASERFAAAKSETVAAARPHEAAQARISPAVTAAQFTGTGRAMATLDIVPVPIKFVFRKAEFTEEGRTAGDLLLQYLLAARPAAVYMNGHADERGTHAFNLSLSADRLETVAAFLRAGGFTGRLKLIPKGDTEPYSGIDRTITPRDQLYDLDRRVELHVAD